MRMLSGLAFAAVALAGTLHLAPPAIAQKAAPSTVPAKPAAKKTASPCKGLSQSACTAATVCGWVVPKKKVASNGRKLSPYCRKVAGIAKKKK